MALKQSPPFRAEHLGSLLRPDYLLEARRKFNSKDVTQEQLREFEDKAITEVVNLQREVGIKAFTDGEYRRHMFYEGFFEYLEGFEVILNPPSEIFKPYVPAVKFFHNNDTEPAATIICTGKIRHVTSGYIPQFEALKKLVHPDEVKNIKLSMVPPEWLHIFHGDHAFTPAAYGDREEYFNDIATAYRQELEMLYDAGCRNIQIDAPLLTFFCDISMLQGLSDDGENPDALFDTYIRLYNNCLATRPRDMTIGLHLCRGNYKHSIHFAEGSYDAIAEKVFNDVDVDCYYLEYDTPRAGTFEPLKHFPRHKSLVLGLITSKFPELEDKAQLRDRVFEAARIMASSTGETVDEALQRISVSPQCGFASHEDGNLLTTADMRKKLKLVKDLAMSIWEDDV